MSELDAITMLEQAIWITIVASGPIVLSAMLVGTAVAVLQALTQVQEMTLTFVPKMLIGMLVLAVAAPYIGNMLKIFFGQICGHIADGFN